MSQEFTSIGIIHPPGVEGPFQDCPRLYFSEAFLTRPPKWCQVALPPEPDAHTWLAEMSEWDTEHYHACLHAGYDLIRYGKDILGYWFLWPRGTLITHDFPHLDPGHRDRRVVWRLTGLYFPLTQSTVYEGKWPD